MSGFFGRLALGLLGALAMSSAALAGERGYADGYGYDYGYEEGYASGSRETRVHTEDRYGAREQRSGSGYESGYGYEYGSRDGYERVRHGPESAPCDWNRPYHPEDLQACPPAYGVVTLPGSFFHGGGGVGPEYIARGGGGGGFVYAGATAGAGAYAFARASASARVSFGGKGGGRHPGRKGGGCGCR